MLRVSGASLCRDDTIDEILVLVDNCYIISLFNYSHRGLCNYVEMWHFYYNLLISSEKALLLLFSNPTRKSELSVRKIRAVRWKNQSCLLEKSDGSDSMSHLKENKQLSSWRFTAFKVTNDAWEGRLVLTLICFAAWNFWAACTNCNDSVVEDTRRRWIKNKPVYCVLLSACTNFNLLRSLKLGGASEIFK